MSWTLSSGDVLAHYRVLSPLGSGGMGQVYLAEDLRLGRRLALKVLSPRALEDEERLRRFEREARTISNLNHPNILTVYDIGHVGEMQFLATEYVDGLTLRALLDREPVGIRRALDIGIQVAQALAAAHDAGFVHRDLKPENVMIRADGYVKVLDFGLAKLTGQEWFGAGADAPTNLATGAGVVMGTFNYMAPEQARGGDLDLRADLFAFGVLLYEMLAGRRPFDGPTAADVVGAILFKEPEPFDPTAGVPVALEQVIALALRKDREHRYQTTGQVLEDLRGALRALDLHGDASLSFPPASGDQSVSGIGARPVRRRRTRRGIESLAVLPIVSHSPDEDLDYLSDGLTESLINNLSQLPRLRVMARSTVFRFKHQERDPILVGRELGVEAVLTGHLMQRGSTLVVSAELVDVLDGSRIWGTRLDRQPDDVFALQADIAAELSGALRLRLTRDEQTRLRKHHTASAEAYQLYLRGRYFLNTRTGDALQQARTLFERAVAADPQYALAHAGLADCCALLAVSLRSSAVGVLIEEARAAAERALALDDSLADGHVSMAFIRFRFDWDWAGAEAEFARALTLNPGHAPLRQWHAMYLASRRRFDAALAEMRRALELDPLSLIIQSGIGRILHFAGRYDEAIAQFQHVLQTNPRFGQAHIDLALTRLARGEVPWARAELQRAEDLLGRVSTIVLVGGCCAARDGRLQEARAAFAELGERYDRAAAGADDLALLAAVLGDWPAAREWLAEACAQRAPFLGYVDVEPAMAALWDDPDCRAQLEQHGFGQPH